jgi:asparagine synthase (glutamine-hydrolysing)
MLLGRRQLCRDAHAWGVVTAVDARGGRTTPLDRLSFLESRIYLPNDILTKVDRMSMAHSLEARGPFLDHHLVEWTAGLPAHLKLRRGETKYLLRRLAARYLPASVLRRPKQGFAAPLSVWWKGDFQHQARQLLLEPGSACRRTFSPSALESTLAPRAVSRGGGRAAEKVWILLSFEYWHRTYIDNTFGRF